MNDGPAQFADYGLHLAAVTLYEGTHLIVRAPRNEYLLGMKVQAARPEDVDDTVWLMADTGLRAAAELHQAAAAPLLTANDGPRLRAAVAATGGDYRTIRH